MPVPSILSPRAIYERLGDVGNVVFSCGAIHEPNNGEIKLYYGAADTCICGGVVSVERLLDLCMQGGVFADESAP